MHQMKRAAASALALLGLLCMQGPIAGRSDISGPVVIPLHLTHGPFGDPRLGIDVSIGSATLHVLFDTGSSGLRVLASAVPNGIARRTGPSSVGLGSYGSGLVLTGAPASAPVSVGAANSPSAAFELVDGFSCAASRPNCPSANGGTPEMFGRLFPGIFGASPTGPPNDRCCQNPLFAFGDTGSRYIVHSNFAGPTLTLNPDAQTTAAFSFVDLPNDGGRLGMPSGCLRISGVPDICGTVIFDTGSPQLSATTTTPVNVGPVAPGTLVMLNMGSWSHEFTTGPRERLRLSIRQGPTNNIIVGLAALQHIDVFYDRSGRIGMLTR